MNAYFRYRYFLLILAKTNISLYTIKTKKNSARENTFNKLRYLVNDILQNSNISRPMLTQQILTLRLLMSYIYIYIYIYIYMERIFLMFLDHTQRRSTVGLTPLDE